MRRADNLTTLKFRSLKPLEPSGPLQVSNRINLPLSFTCFGCLQCPVCKQTSVWTGRDPSCDKTASSKSRNLCSEILENSHIYMVAHPVHCAYDCLSVHTLPCPITRLDLVLTSSKTRASKCTFVFHCSLSQRTSVIWQMAAHYLLSSTSLSWPCLAGHMSYVLRDKLRPLLQFIDSLFFLITRCYRIVRLK